MDEFNALSLNSTIQDDILEESDLLAISNLSISEKKPIAEDLISKFLPYSPPCPSPLRSTVSIPESCLSDKMDIDEEYDNSLNVNTIPGNKSNEDIIEEIETEDEDDTNREQKGLIKALLSPTSLGIALATRDLNKNEQDEDHKQLGQQNEQEESKDVPVTITDKLPTEPTEEKTSAESISSSNEGSQNVSGLQTPERQKRPWQINIQNHHHYYMVTDANGEPYKYTPPIEEVEQAENENENQLPVPWSSKSRPASKASYAFTTYLQMALNTLTVMIICSTITAFAKSVRTDIRATWEHQKLELDYESAKCKVQYLANHCADNEVVPALYDQCNEWARCMSRDNKIYFRARTSLGAKLFAEIVNSLIEPLGWKTLLVILLTLAIWCFSSNFVLGFMRAKSYYGGSPTQTHPQIQSKSQPNAGSLLASEVPPASAIVVTNTDSNTKTSASSNSASSSSSPALSKKNMFT